MSPSAETQTADRVYIARGARGDGDPLTVEVGQSERERVAVAGTAART
jgi:hypothetical protein